MEYINDPELGPIPLITDDMTDAEKEKAEAEIEAKIAGVGQDQ